MQNLRTNIEPGSQPSSSQITRRNLGQAPQNHNPLSEDEVPDPGLKKLQTQSQRQQNRRPEAKLETRRTKLFDINPYKALRITIYLLLFFFALNLVPFSIVLYTRFRVLSPELINVKRSLDSMYVSLALDPVMDIRIIDKMSTCSPGFDPLQLAVWYGTLEGCHCNNGDLFDVPCRSDQTSKCKTVPGTQMADILSADGLVWCARRAALGTDYIMKADCPRGTKECYPGGCFRGECPITKVEVASKGEPNKKFRKNKEKYLALTRKQGELPLIKIQITPNDIPCLNQFMFAKSPNGDSPYPLLYIQANGCDKYGLNSPLSTRLESQPTLDYFTQWKSQQMTRNLPYFLENTEKTTSVLSWRVRMNTAKNDHCFNLDKIKDPIDNFESSLLPNPILIGSLALHIGIVLYFLIVKSFSADPDKTFRFFEKLEAMTIIKGLGIFYSQLVLLFFTKLDAYQKLKLTKIYFEEFDTLRCFGEDMVIRDSLDILEKGELNLLMYFGLLFTNGLAILVCFWYWVVQKRASQKRNL